MNAAQGTLPAVVPEWHRWLRLYYSPTGNFIKNGQMLSTGSASHSDTVHQLTNKKPHWRNFPELPLSASLCVSLSNPHNVIQIHYNNMKNLLWVKPYSSFLFCFVNRTEMGKGGNDVLRFQEVMELSMGHWDAYWLAMDFSWDGMPLLRPLKFHA